MKTIERRHTTGGGYAIVRMEWEDGRADKGTLVLTDYRDRNGKRVRTERRVV